MTPHPAWPELVSTIVLVVTYVGVAVTMIAVSGWP